MEHRWFRRLIAVPLVLVALAVGLPLAPLVFLAAFTFDGIMRSPVLPTVRFVSLAFQLLLLEVVAIAAAFVLWVASGFGIAMRSRPVQRWHGRVQSWWAGKVAGAAARSLGVRFKVTGEELLRPGPVIVLCQHASYVDALLPALLLGTRAGFSLRYVLADELSWLPSLNIFGRRLPNVFVKRRTADAGHVASIGRLAGGLTGETAVVIFPEGQFPTPQRRDRALAAIARTDADRAARVAVLRQVLPPRPAGTLALLGAAPHADIVVVAHRGLGSLGSLKALRGDVPLRRPVDVKISRILASEVPVGSEEQVRWLDDRWGDIDRWMETTG